MMDRRTAEGLLAQLDDARDIVARILEEMPRPPQRALDIDAVEAVMREDEGQAWTSTAVARAAAIPLYRARAALALLGQVGVVERAGTTRGTRYRIASAITSLVPSREIVGGQRRRLSALGNRRPRASRSAACRGAAPQAA